MPKGPNGEWRPAETGPCAVHVMKIATGEIEETYSPPEKDADHAAASSQASQAGKARALKLTPERRSEIAKAAAAARWGAQG
jgi:acyl-CoA reductase-like NAD-dependent aldehyde dehydrogenase